MQPKTYPFYPFSLEDRQLKKAQKKGLITQETRVTPYLKEQCGQYVFKLDPACRHAILAIPRERFEVKSRVPLHIVTSMQELSLEVRKVAYEKFQTDLKTLFVGGGLLKALQPLFADFFTKCGLNDLMTMLFKTKLQKKPNDYDFQFVTTLKKPEDYQTLMDEGITSPLSRQIKWELINPILLNSQLKKAKNYSHKCSKDSYLRQVFDSKDEDLAKLVIKVLGFAKANNSPGKFHFKKIASEQTSYDCFIPVGNVQQINSFCIDISEIDKEDKELYLDSLLGKEMLLQAIMDANFAILYTEPNHVANELDFARTICYLSKQGRLFGEGWLAKAFAALDCGRKKRQSTLALMLAQQLISRADNHHSSPQQALIVLAMNASSILINLDPLLEEEIQKLWQEIGNHLIKIGKVHLKDPLLEEIKVLLCHSGCSFQDVLLQIQITAMLKQHECKEGAGTYKCRPSQSEGMLFTQILINFSEEEQDVDYCTLFFPYAISGLLAPIPKLKALHDLLSAGSNLAVGMNKSVLKKDKYRLDPRRKFSECIRLGLSLLEKDEQDEHIWKMGFLMTLSNLSMCDDEMLLRGLLKHLIHMLLDKWPKGKLKSEAALLMQEMLKNSGINVRTTFFQNPTRNVIIGDLLSSDSKCLKNLGWDCFKKIENDRHELLKRLYLDLIHSYLHSQKLGRDEYPFLKDLLNHMTYSNQLSLDAFLRVYITLYNHAKLLPEENDLLELFLLSMRRITILDDKISTEVRDVLPSLIQLVLKIKTNKPHLSLSLALEAHRLKILTKESIDAVQTIHKNLIEKIDVHSIYLSEKFDVLSDFMQHCSLQSVHALKASISRRILTQDGLFHLLQLLVKSDEAWNERFFIMDALKRLSDREIQEIFGFFVNSVLNHPKNEQVLFYLEQIQFGSFLLQPLLALLCDETTVYLDETFIHATKRVLQFPKEIQQEILEKFLQQLFQRELWKELEDIYFAEPAILPAWTAETLSIFIHSSFIKGDAKQLLKTLPLDLTLPPVLKKELIVLMRENQKTSLEQREFTDTLQWMAKLKKLEDQESFLALTKEIVPILMRQWECKDSGFYELIHQVFCWNNKEPVFLLKYIQLVIANAPRSIAEKIAMRLLSPLAWWSNLWKEVILDHVKRDLVYALIEGAVIAIEPLRLKDRVSGIKEVLNVLASRDIAPLLTFEEKTFSCSLRVQFAKLCWLSEIPEEKSKALSILADTFLLIGDEYMIEENAVQLANLFLQTMSKLKTIEDIRLALILIQRVQVSGSSESADAASILRFVSDILRENEHKDCKQFFIESAGFILDCIFRNVKIMLEMHSKEIKLVKWGVNRLYDSKVLLGYDLAVLCLQCPHISSYLNENEIEKLEKHNEFIKGCYYSVKAIRVWNVFLEYKNAIATPMGLVG